MIVCEMGAAREGLTIENFGETKKDNAKVWKLHGSCHFKLNGIDLTRGIFFTTGIGFDADIEVIDPSEVPKIYKGDTALYPAMCLYAKGKPLAIANDIITSKQREWAEKVRTAEKIFVIGVRPMIDDDHIWQPIADSTGSLYFIGDKPEFENWVNLNRPNKTNVYLDKYWINGETKIYDRL